MDSEEDDQAGKSSKGADLNKLFSGNAADGSDEEKDFESKLSKKHKKMNKKKNQDRILFSKAPVRNLDSTQG